MASAAAADDCRLIDCPTPIVERVDATRRIRATGIGIGAASVPIAALTANTTIRNQDRCLEAGMNDYQSKPFDRAALLAALA